MLVFRALLKIPVPLYSTWKVYCKRFKFLSFHVNVRFIGISWEVTNVVKMLNETMITGVKKDEGVVLVFCGIL